MVRYQEDIELAALSNSNFDKVNIPEISTYHGVSEETVIEDIKHERRIHNE